MKYLEGLVFDKRFSTLNHGYLGFSNFDTHGLFVGYPGKGQKLCTKKPGKLGKNHGQKLDKTFNFRWPSRGSQAICVM